MNMDSSKTAENIIGKAKHMLKFQNNLCSNHSKLISFI